MGSPQFQPICPDRPLRLYDEPHGSEYFVIDELTSPPVWYRMNGLPLSPTAAPDTIRCPSEIRDFVRNSGLPNASILVSQ